jgi:HSP20 family protein
MTLIKRNINSPFLPDWLEDFFPSEFPQFGKLNTAIVPRVNIYENTDSYRIELAAPGLKKEDFKIQLDHDVLTISSEKSETKTDESEKCTKKEYSYTLFSRSFTLPESADKESISAKNDDGILTVTVKKKDESIVKPSRQIEIQ